MTENDRLKIVQKALNFSSQEKFANSIGIKQGSLSDIYRKKAGVGVSDSIKRILENEYSINIKWLESGEGEMLKPNSGVKFYDLENTPNERNLIPFYDDVSSFGGNLPGRSANMESNNPPSEWIDPGDWFKNATAALRHYGDSMIEYPAGCILALKEVQDRRLIVPGKDYVIETSEYRITKKIQLCSAPEYIRAYSTNEEKYDDGALKHQPFDIPLSLIGRLFEVLGYVVKKGGGTIVFSNQNKQ